MKNLDISRKHKIQQTFKPDSKVPDRFSSAQFPPLSHAAVVGNSAPPIKAKRIFRTSFILVPVMLLVLFAGTIIGSRFIKFAKSVSISPDNSNVVQNISNTVGAVLGSAIPSLQNLDQSALQDDIRGKKTVNILLLGYGGDGHQGSYLTDSILLLNIDFATNKSALISVPRDTWTQIPTDGSTGSFWKINAAYELGMADKQFPNKQPQFTGAAGGGNLAKYEISKVIGMPIDYFVAVDFSGFKTVVDDLGGVTINVDNTFTDYSYPESDQTVNGAWCVADDVQATPQPTDCRYKEVHFDAGVQFMDGDRALEYVRSRHAAGIEGSDFARSRHQQKLISAIVTKAMSGSDITKVLQLLNDVQGHFKTDLSLAEIKDLSSYINKVNLAGAQHLSINDNGLEVSGTSSDGQYILTPAAGLENWGQIQTYIFDALNGIKTNTKTN